MTLDNSGGITFSSNATAGDAFFPNGKVVFTGTSTAGNATFVNDSPGPGSGFGSEEFQNSSTAGNATITNNADGSVTFVSDSSAGNAIINKAGGYTTFNEGSYGTANGGNATIINDGSSTSLRGGSTVFGRDSFAANATLVAKSGSNGGSGGKIFFKEYAKGGTARIELFGNGLLNIGYNFSRLGGVTVGSIEGDGQIFLGWEALTVGSNNLSTTFSGVIQDGGSLIKIGRGVLTLANSNTYTGGTIIKKGTLLAATNAGSATGTGSVQVVNSATLGGPGRISGSVTVGDGTHSGATLLGGSNATTRGTLSIDNTLTFKSLSTYRCVLNRTSGNASRINAVGVTINNGANFTFVESGMGTLAPGTVLMVISNISASPFAGTFANLPDGSTLTSNGNTFKVNYQGNDGNDLTLTVVR